MKKLISLLLAVVLVVSCMSTAIFAADTPTVTVELKSSSANELTVTYKLSNNPGFKGYGLNVKYDEKAMTLKSLKAGKLSEGAFTANVDEGYVNYASATEVTGNGVLFTAVFDISDIEVGKYKFSVSGSVADASYTKHKVDVDSCTYNHACSEHAWSEWTVVTPATCIEKGVKTRTCSICGEVETETIGTTRHKYGVDDVCDVCGKVKSTSDKDNENEEEVIVLPFADVAVTDWFYNDIVYVYANGLMNGVSASEFAPYGITTRGQIVTILWRLEGQPAVAGACPFTDVAAGSYYETAITWAAANGIVTGYDATTFGPDNQITREQMAAILYRYAMSKELAAPAQENNLVAFNDANQIAGYAMEAMNWAVGQGLINGMGDGSVAPQGQAIRAQAAAILHRFCETLELL